MDEAEYKKIRPLKIKAAKGQPLNSTERNMIKIYDKKIAKENNPMNEKEAKEILKSFSKGGIIVAFDQFGDSEDLEYCIDCKLEIESPEEGAKLAEAINIAVAAYSK